MESIQLTSDIIREIRITSFIETIGATFIGALLAFIFSFILFLIQVWIKERLRLKKLKTNLISEIEFNLSFLEKYREDINDLIGRIQADDKEVYFNMRSHKLQRSFITQYFTEGLLYEKLTADEIDDLDSILGFFTDTTNRLGWEKLDQFRSGDITKAKARSHFKYDLDKIKEAESILLVIKEKYQ